MADTVGKLNSASSIANYMTNFASMTYEQQIEYTRNYLAELDRNSELKTAINKVWSKAWKRVVQKDVQKVVRKDCPREFLRENVPWRQLW